MSQSSRIFASQLGDRQLVVDFGDGELNFCRIRSGQLEFRSTRWQPPHWFQLTPEDILQHLMLQTPVAAWLKSRMKLGPRYMGTAA